MRSIALRTWPDHIEVVKDVLFMFRLLILSHLPVGVLVLYLLHITLSLILFINLFLFLCILFIYFLKFFVLGQAYVVRCGLAHSALFNLFIAGFFLSIWYVLPSSFLPRPSFSSYNQNTLRKTMTIMIEVHSYP